MELPPTHRPALVSMLAEPDSLGVGRGPGSLSEACRLRSGSQRPEEEAFTVSAPGPLRQGGLCRPARVFVRLALWQGHRAPRRCPDPEPSLERGFLVREGAFSSQRLRGAAAGVTPAPEDNGTTLMETQGPACPHPHPQQSRGGGARGGG